MVFDVRGEAICPGCGALWHRGTDNTVKLVRAAPTRMGLPATVQTYDFGCRTARTLLNRRSRHVPAIGADSDDVATRA